MKKADMIKENFINMKDEYLASHHNACRKIDAIFRDELKRFQAILNNFNNEFKCIEDSELHLIQEDLQEIFNTFKVMLVDDYESKFNANVDLLSNTMHDFFIRKLSNKNLKAPSKEINKYLKRLCNFDYFKVCDDLEDKLLKFLKKFIYKYVNNDDAKLKMEYQMKNINYTIICELKKVISSSIDDKQDIARRYNTLNKEILGSDLVEETN